MYFTSAKTNLSLSLEAEILFSAMTCQMLWKKASW